MVLQHNSLPQSLSFFTGPPLLTPQLAFCLALGLPTLKPFPGPRSERLSDFFPPRAAPSLAPPQPIPSHPRARPLTCSVARSGTPRSPPPDTVAGASCPAPASTVRMRLRRELCSSARASGGAQRRAARSLGASRKRDWKWALAAAVCVAEVGGCAPTRMRKKRLPAGWEAGLVGRRGSCLFLGTVSSARSGCELGSFGTRVVGVAGERVRAESSLQLHTKQKGLLLKLASP